MQSTTVNTVFGETTPPSTALVVTRWVDKPVGANVVSGPFWEHVSSVWRLGTIIHGSDKDQVTIC